MKAKEKGVDIRELQPLMFPVISQSNASGQQSGRYTPFNVEIIKDLKKACTNYGATSAYVKVLLQNLAFEVLTPDDWKSIARVCLEPGQNYMWLSEYSELCRLQAQQNSQNAVHTAITYDLLQGIGPYADVTAQVNYSVAAYEQIAANAIKAWDSIHNKNDKGEAFTKIMQGPDEPFADFVGRLQTAITRTNGENPTTDVLIRQLAKENANEVCRRIILGLPKDAPLEEFIRRCATVGTNAFYSQTMMQTSQDPNMGRQGPFQQGTSRETCQCFQCGKVGHLKAQCWYRGRMRKQGGRTRPSIPCPKCNRGFHWASECRQVQGNGMRGPAPGPQAKNTWGMMAANGAPRECLDGQYPNMTNQPGSHMMAERDYTINQPGSNLMEERDYN
ncbi:endogenous retrovirus group K member 24 Gag polyprotein-like [Sarcophilus harrisii]